MKKLKYLTAIAIILTVSFIGFSSFSASGAKTVEVDGLTYEVVGEYNGDKIVKVYKTLEINFGDSKPLFEYGNSNMSQQGNYNTYEKANTICEEFLLKRSGYSSSHAVYIQELRALESNLSKLDVK